MIHIFTIAKRAIPAKSGGSPRLRNLWGSMLILSPVGINTGDKGMRGSSRVFAKVGAASWSWSV